MDARELGRRGVKERHAEDGGVLVHGGSRIDLGVAAVADDDDAPAHGDDAEVLLEIHVREHLEHHVDAAVARETHHLVEIARRRVIEHVMRALSEHELLAALRPRGADHREASRPRELHRADPDPSARPVHEHRLAGLAVAAIEQRVVGGGIGHVHRRALREADASGQRMHLRLLAERQLSVGAGRRAADVHALAGLDARDARADRLDDTCRVTARRVGQLGPAVVGVRAQIGVHRIHADGVIPDQHLAGPGLGRGNLLELQHLGTAVGRHADRFHRSGSFRVGREVT